MLLNRGIRGFENGRRTKLQSERQALCGGLVSTLKVGGDLPPILPVL